MRTITILLFQCILFYQLNAQCTGIFVNFFPDNETPIVGFCSRGDGLITIPVTPEGGTFSGSGMTGNQFDPEAAGIGEHVITYTVTLDCGTISGDLTLFVNDCCPITNIEVDVPTECDPFDPPETFPVDFTIEYTPDEFSSNRVFAQLANVTYSSPISLPSGVAGNIFDVTNNGTPRTLIIGDEDGHCAPTEFPIAPLDCGCGLELISLNGDDAAFCPSSTVSRTFVYQSATPVNVSLDNGNTFIPDLTLFPPSGLSQFTLSGIPVGTHQLVLRSADDPTCISEAIEFTVSAVPPQPRCNDLTVYLDENGLVDVPASDIINRNDLAFCEDWSLDLAPNAFNCSDIGSNVVILTATTTTVLGEQSSTCSSAVTVEDVLPPTVDCRDITVAFNGEGRINLDPAQLVDASDNCEVAEIAIEPEFVTCNQIGELVEVDVVVTDAAGITSVCSAFVTVTGLPCGFSTCPGHIDCSESFASFDPTDETFHLTGVNCFYVSPYNSDETAYIRHDFCGNGEIIAELESVGGTTFGWAGLSLRESCDPGSKKFEIIHNGSNLIRREARIETNGFAFPQQYPIFNRRWFRLQRMGNQFIAYISPNGVNWQFIGAKTIDMPFCIEAGLAVTNYQQVSEVTGVFSNVHISSQLPSPTLTEMNPSSDLPYFELEKENDKADQFKAYPNPTTGMVTVEFDSSQASGQLDVINNLGKSVQSYAIDPHGPAYLELNLEGLPKGVYFLRMKHTDGYALTERLVLQ